MHLKFLAAGFGVLLSALPLAAHHSFAAEYDSTKTVTVKGVINRLAWVNPHAYIGNWLACDPPGQTGCGNCRATQGSRSTSLAGAALVNAYGGPPQSRPYEAAAFKNLDSPAPQARARA